MSQVPSLSHPPLPHRAFAYLCTGRSLRGTRPTQPSLLQHAPSQYYAGFVLGEVSVIHQTEDKNEIAINT